MVLYIYAPHIAAETVSCKLRGVCEIYTGRDLKVICVIPIQASSQLMEDCCE